MASFLAASGLVTLTLSGVDTFSRDLNKVGGEMSTFKDKLDGLGQAAGRVLLAGAAAVGAAAAIGGGFEQAMARVKAVTGATEDQFQALSGQAKQLGRDTQFTASDAAEAMGNLAQAGFSVGEIMASLPGILNLASAGQISIAEASDTVAKTLRQTGKAASETGAIVDIMTQAFVKSNTDITMLGHAFNYAAVTAKGANQDITQTTAAIMALSDAGMQGSMAGTSLRMIFAGLLDARVQKSFSDIGVAVKDATGNIRPLSQIMTDTKAALAATGDATAVAAFAFANFGQRAGPAFQVLTNQAGAGLDGLIQKLNESGGVAERIANIQNDTFFGSLKRIASAAQDVAITLFETIVPSLMAFAEAIIPVLNATSVWIAANDDLVLALFGIGGALLTIMKIIPAIVKMWPMVAMSAVLAFKSIIVGGMALIGWIVGAGIGNALEKSFDFSGFLLKVGLWAGAFLSGVWKLVKGIGQLFAALGKYIWDKLTGGDAEFDTQFMDNFRGAFKGMGAELDEQFKQIDSMSSKNGKSFGQNFVDGVNDELEKVIDVGSDLLAPMIDPSAFLVDLGPAKPREKTTAKQFTADEFEAQTPEEATAIDTKEQKGPALIGLEELFRQISTAGTKEMRDKRKEQEKIAETAANTARTAAAAERLANNVAAPVVS